MRLKSLFILPLAILIPVVVRAEVASSPAVGTVHDPLSSFNLIQVILSLIIVLSIIAAGAFFLRRYGRLSTTANGALCIVASLSMGARERIILLQAGEKQLLIGVAPGSIKTLYVLDEPIRKDNPSVSGHISFTERLNAVLNAHKNR